MDFSKLDSLFRKFPARKAPPVKRQYNEGQSVQRNRQMEAIETADRLHKLYLESRARRLVRLTNDHPEVARYLKGLDKLAITTAATGPEDVDIDLAEYAERCRLRTVPGAYDRYLLLEYTGTWVEILARKAGVYTLECPEPLPLDGVTPTSLSLLREYLLTTMST
jgi:hypothetical protein